MDSVPRGVSLRHPVMMMMMVVIVIELYAQRKKENESKTSDSRRKKGGVEKKGQTMQAQSDKLKGWKNGHKKINKFFTVEQFWCFNWTKNV